MMRPAFFAHTSVSSSLRTTRLRPSVRAASLLALPLAALLCVGCGAPIRIPVERSFALDLAPVQEKDQGKDKGDEPRSEEDFRERIADQTEEKIETQLALVYAEAEAEIALLGQQADELELEQEAWSAAFELQKAREELARFVEVERPLDAQEAEMEVAAAEDRVIVARTDMEGLEEIFAEETEARAKPEILRRARRTLERAEQNLQLELARRQMKLERELPARQRELEAAAQKAEAELAHVTADAAKKRRETALEIQKARDETETARRKAQRAATELTTLQAEFNELRGAARETAGQR